MTIINTERLNQILSYLHTKFVSPFATRDDEGNVFRTSYLKRDGKAVDSFHADNSDIAQDAEHAATADVADKAKLVEWENVNGKPEKFIAEGGHADTADRVTGMEESTDDAATPIWFSKAEDVNHPTYSTDLSYNPKEKALSVTRVAGKADEAITADTAKSVEWRNVANRPATMPANGGTAEAAKYVQAKYTGNGGQQGPDYFGKEKAGVLSSNQAVNGHTGYKNWLYMDGYSGNDKGGASAIGVARDSSRAFIMKSNDARTEWDESAEVVTDKNVGTLNAGSANVAKMIGKDGSTSSPMKFHWSKQGGQPIALWGGNDETDMYTYNPSNFDVARVGGQTAEDIVQAAKDSVEPSIQEINTTISTHNHSDKGAQIPTSGIQNGAITTAKLSTEIQNKLKNSGQIVPKDTFFVDPKPITWDSSKTIEVNSKIHKNDGSVEQMNRRVSASSLGSGVTFLSRFGGYEYAKLPSESMPIDDDNITFECNYAMSKNSNGEFIDDIYCRTKHTFQGMESALNSRIMQPVTPQNKHYDYYMSGQHCKEGYYGPLPVPVPLLQDTNKYAYYSNWDYEYCARFYENRPWTVCHAFIPQATTNSDIIFALKAIQNSNYAYDIRFRLNTYDAKTDTFTVDFFLNKYSSSWVASDETKFPVRIFRNKPCFLALSYDGHVLKWFINGILAYSVEWAPATNVLPYAGLNVFAGIHSDKKTGAGKAINLYTLIADIVVPNAQIAYWCNCMGIPVEYRALSEVSSSRVQSVESGCFILRNDRDSMLTYKMNHKKPSSPFETNGERQFKISPFGCKAVRPTFIIPWKKISRRVLKEEEDNIDFDENSPYTCTAYTQNKIRHTTLLFFTINDDGFVWSNSRYSYYSDDETGIGLRVSKGFLELCDENEIPYYVIAKSKTTIDYNKPIMVAVIQRDEDKWDLCYTTKNGIETVSGDYTKCKYTTRNEWAKTSPYSASSNCELYYDSVSSGVTLGDETLFFAIWVDEREMTVDQMLAVRDAVYGNMQTRNFLTDVPNCFAMVKTRALEDGNREIEQVECTPRFGCKPNPLINNKYFIGWYYVAANTLLVIPNTYGSANVKVNLYAKATIDSSTVSVVGSASYTSPGTNGTSNGTPYISVNSQYIRIKTLQALAIISSSGNANEYGAPANYWLGVEVEPIADNMNELEISR